MRMNGIDREIQTEKETEREKDRERKGQREKKTENPPPPYTKILSPSISFGRGGKAGGGGLREAEKPKYWSI